MVYDNLILRDAASIVAASAATGMVYGEVSEAGYMATVVAPNSDLASRRIADHALRIWQQDGDPFYTPTGRGTPRRTPINAAAVSTGLMKRGDGNEVISVRLLDGSMAPGSPLAKAYNLARRSHIPEFIRARAREHMYGLVRQIPLVKIELGREAYGPDAWRWREKIVEPNWLRKSGNGVERIGPATDRKQWLIDVAADLDCWFDPPLEFMVHDEHTGRPQLRVPIAHIDAMLAAASQPLRDIHKLRD